MTKKRVAATVLRGAEALGLALPVSAADAFETYYSLLEKEGRKNNLTAIRGEADVANLHFLDSIALLKAARFAGARVIDVGSGAGFPGVPIKISEPSAELTLLDSAAKRVAFLLKLCGELGLEAACIQARSEVAAHYPDMRERFDVAVSRAVARLNVLCELCLPFVRVGGVFISMKGADPADELAEASGAMEVLGAQFQEFFEYTIPGTDVTHCAILLKKTTETPGKYPRRFARIQNSPL